MSEIKKILKEGNQLEATLSFTKDSEYFKGHFPDLPILPGFVQTHFAMSIAKKHFKINPVVMNLKKLKFTQIIRPQQEVALQLNYCPDANSLSFKYCDNESIYSSGKFYFK